MARLTKDGLTIYDLQSQASELCVVAGPAGYDPKAIDTDSLPDGFRWVTNQEWEELQSDSKKAVNYEFFGRASADAHLAAGAVADAMEALDVNEVSREVIDHAVRSLGDGWDFKSVEALIGNCSFEVYDV